MVLRDVKKLPWLGVASRVVNLQGGHPSVRLVQRVHKKFNSRVGHRRLHYDRCGRKPWKVTRPVEMFLVRRLKVMRKSTVCTASTLQRELASRKGIQLDASTISKVLRKHGYRWLPRCQKPAASSQLAAQRLAFARRVLRMSAAALREKMSLSLDGVVLSMPPRDATDRHNYCLHGTSHMYRLPQESAHPDLAGMTAYAEQIPASRCFPLWGGISAGGFAIVTWHKQKGVEHRPLGEGTPSREAESGDPDFEPRVAGGPVGGVGRRREVLVGSRQQGSLCSGWHHTLESAPEQP